MGNLTEGPRTNQLQPEIRKALAQSRRKLIFTAICASIACTCVTVFAQSLGDSVLAPGTLALITSGSAVAFSIAVIARQNVRGLFPRLYASLGTALSLWFAAESIWVYYEVVASITTPFPSVADALWLAGYVPYFYFLFGIVKHFLGMSRSLIFPVLPLGAIGFVLLGYILFSIYQDADLTSQDGIVAYFVGSAYPVADMLVLVPALAAFVQLRRGLLTFTPWIMIVTATIAMIVADIGFAYSALLAELEEHVWVWNPIYNIQYIALAISLFWHKSFFTINEKKQMRLWEESNR
jgi:hypothetical protein